MAVHVSAVDLRGARAKLGRADEHFSSVVEQLNAWIDRRPYSVVVERHGNERERVLRMSIHEPVPERVALTIGDCVHNVRSSLDHFVWAATIHHLDGAEPRRPKLIQFPIYDTADSWRDRASGAVGQVAPALRDAIEKAQPYNRPATFAVDPLRLVGLMDNVDKHKTVQVVLMLPHSLGVMRENEPIRGTVRVNFDTPLVDGAELARLVLDEPDADMHVDWFHAVVPMLPHDPWNGFNGATVDSMLRRLIDDVRDLIFRLAPLA